MYKDLLFIEDGLSTVKKTGVGHYTVMLETCLTKMGIKIFHVNKNYIINLKPIKLRRFFYTLWLNSIFLFKLMMQKGNKKVIFTNTNTPIFKIPNTEYISVVHDMRPFKIPKYSSSKFINYYERRKVFKAIKRAHRIVTVSETVKQEVIEYFNYPSEKISVIYNSIGPHFYNFEDNLNVIKRYGLEEKKYFLTVSTRQKWKHMPLIIDAFKNISKDFPEYKLVLVGKAGNDNDYVEDKNIIFTGYLEDKDLPVLYKHAYCYISASEDEGFGIPLIEAQFSKIPVICTDIPIYREVAFDNSALFFKLDVDDIASKIDSIINNSELYSSLVNKGSENLNRFSVQNIEKQLKIIL